MRNHPLDDGHGILGWSGGVRPRKRPWAEIGLGILEACGNDARRRGAVLRPGIELALAELGARLDRDGKRTDPALGAIRTLYESYEVRA